MRYHSIIDRDKYGKREGKRGWFNWGEHGEFSYEISSNRKYRLCSIGIGHGTRSIKAHLCIPNIISLHLKLGGILPYGKKREIQLSFNNAALWWKLWIDPWGDERRWPKWRNGSFHFDDFFLGRSMCTREQVEERALEIPMPEGSYPATAKLIRYTWKRPRWFAKSMIRGEIDVPKGIPHEGKGENSWDCGVDATYGMTTGEVRDIPQAVGILVGSVLRDRVRYGGWDDWNWKKNEEKTV